jgi:subtilisin-like proprotein convertase family protein
MSMTSLRGGLALAAATALAATGLGLAAPASASTVITPTNTTPMTIPGTGTSGPASDYPATIAVSGAPKGIIDVNVVLTGLSHTFPADIDMLLVGPAGQQAEFLSDAGNGTDVTGVNLVLDQTAAAPLAEPIVSGTFQPTNEGGADPFDAPAPVATGSSSLDVFNGTDPNGTWSLYVMDNASGDTGSLASWGLQITTQDVPVSPVISAPAVGTRDRDGAFTVAGSAPSGSTVSVLVDGVVKGTATASAIGQWAAPVSGVHNGTHAVTATATDGFGNVSAASAALSVIVDSIKPTVVSTVPANKAKHASTTANVKAKTSEAVRKLTVTKANAFIVVAGTTTHLKANVTWKVGTRQIVINPKADLAHGTTYKVTITTKVLDLAGNPLDQNKSKAGVQKKTWKFTTK